MGVLIQLVYTNRKSEELNQRVYLFNQPLNMSSLTFCRMRLLYLMIEIPIVSIVE